MHSKDRFVYKTFVQQVEKLDSNAPDGLRVKGIQEACDQLDKQAEKFVNEKMQACERIENLRFYQRVFYPPTSVSDPRDPTVTLIINFTMVRVKSNLSA